MPQELKKADNIQVYKEITQEYLNYLSADMETAKSAKISHWRYSLTNVFYRGKHARFILWDMLAGVQNNFLFFIKKSEHADFITLINRISLLDRTSEYIFQEILNASTQEALCDLLLNYFLAIEKNYENKNEEYYRNMKALKRDINHFVEGCGIEKRIQQTIPCAFHMMDSLPAGQDFSSIPADLAYVKSNNKWYFVNKKEAGDSRCQVLTVDKDEIDELNSAFNRNIESLSGEQFYKIVSATGYAPRLHYSYKVVGALDDETKKKKASVRSFKAVWGSCASTMANLMASTEGSIAWAGFKAGVMKLCLGMAAAAMFVIKSVVVISGLFFGYIFAEDEFKSLGKEFKLGRIFKVKNRDTGVYEYLNKFQIGLVCVAPLLSVVAGVCIGSLAFFSIKSCMLPIINIAPPLIFCKACFFCVLPLTTASFFLTLKNVISHLTWEGIVDYCASLTRQPNETWISQAGRVSLEVLKWVIAIGAMLLVACGGYYVFKDKSIDMLHSVWAGLAPMDATKITESFSAIFSATKFPYTVNKIRNILQSVIDWIKSKWDSKKDESETNLNRFQKDASSSMGSYLTGGLLMLRASCTAGFYATASIEHHLHSPLTPVNCASSTWFFALGFYGKPFHEKQEQERTQPIIEAQSANKKMR